MLNFGFPDRWTLLHKLIWLKRLTGGGGGTWKIASGTSPLTLSEAASAGLKRLVQFGKTSQASTPTPSAPVDIVCNNGALKWGALGNNLANVNANTAQIGYYISTSGAITADQFNWIYKYFIPVKPNTAYTLSLSTSVYFVSISEFSAADNSAFIVRKAGSTGSNTSLTITTGATTNYIRFGTNIDRTAVTLDKVLAINWMLNEGSTALPYEAFRGGLFADGTAEEVRLTGKNLLTIDTVVHEASTAEIVLWEGSLTGTYTLSADIAGITTDLPNAGMLKYIVDGTQTIRVSKNTPVQTITGTITKVSAVAATSYSKWTGTCKFQMEEGSTATEWTPYIPVQTAHTENLFQVGTYADEQDIISGHITRKIEIKVFDGTETFIDGNNGYITEAVQDQSGETYAPLCSHYRGTNTAPASNSNTVRCYRTSGGTGRIYFAPNRTTYATKEAFTAFLAEQYAAGTPVIILYPLMTPTAESVTSQHLSTVQGTNIISWTAEVSGKEMEAEYKAAATTGAIVGQAKVGTAKI